MMPFKIDPKLNGVSKSNNLDSKSMSDELSQMDLKSQNVSSDYVEVQQHILSDIAKASAVTGSANLTIEENDAQIAQQFRAKMQEQSRIQQTEQQKSVVMPMPSHYLQQNNQKSLAGRQAREYKPDDYVQYTPFEEDTALINSSDLPGYDDNLPHNILYPDLNEIEVLTPTAIERRKVGTPAPFHNDNPYFSGMNDEEYYKVIINSTSQVNTREIPRFTVPEPTVTADVAAAASTSTALTTGYPRVNNNALITEVLDNMDFGGVLRVAHEILDESDDDIQQIILNMQDDIRNNNTDNINAPADPNFRPDYTIGKFLCQVSVLENLLPHECAIVGGCMRMHKYAPGDVIIRQNDVGRGFYILKVGSAVVVRQDEMKPYPILIDTLHSGEYFGEAALASNTLRGASVIAQTSCEVLFMHRDDFHALFQTTRHANIDFNKREILIIPAEVSNKFHSHYEQRPPDLRKHYDVHQEHYNRYAELLGHALRTQAVFTGMELEHRRRIYQHLWYHRFNKGTVIIRQGDVGDNLYILASGRVNVYLRMENGAQRKVDTFDTPGRCFGELALLYNTPRNATVIAKSDCEVFILDRISFRSIIRNVNEFYIKRMFHYLRLCTIFDTNPVNHDDFYRICQDTVMQTYRPGECVLRNSVTVDALYIILEGKVGVWHVVDNEYIPIQVLGPQQMFGEKVLLDGGVTTSHYQTLTPVRIVKIDQYCFYALLRPLYPRLFITKDIIIRLELNAKNTRQPSVVIDDHIELAPKVEILANNHPHLRLDNLRVLGFLGKGGYGYVELVQDRKTNETYALKSLYRAHLIKTKSTNNVINEKRLLAMFDSPSIIKLHATFKDEKKLYFLLEPCLGGELFTLLRVRSVFDDRSARFYAASVILAIEEMHSKGVVYRDLKPENILLDDTGYVKVTDFGLSKQIHANRTFTVCGTPHYLAPEVIRGVGHGLSVDLWCLGVLIYEMLSGRPPFYRSGERGDHMKLYKRIANHEIFACDQFTEEAWNLIQRLLQPREDFRLGYNNRFDQIKGHSWFLGFRWEELIKRHMRAPIIPFLRAPEDTHNFKKLNPGYVQPGKDMPVTGDMSWDQDF